MTLPGGAPLGVPAQKTGNNQKTGNKPSTQQKRSA